METIRVFLNEELSGNVVCKKCGNLKQINFQGKEIPLSATAKCKCGNIFAISFEKRQYYRKQVSITGKCFFPGDREAILIKLTDVSQGGVSFVKPTAKNPQPDDTIKITFELENGTINCTAKICNVHNDRVGARFTSIDEHSRKILGFFLLP